MMISGPEKLPEKDVIAAMTLGGKMTRCTPTSAA
jgi:hypothetical protein